MKIYKTQEEVEKDIKNDVLEIKGDVKFECSISIDASIRVIYGDINARDINARDINAWDINARDINARGINALDINARDINAEDILYYAFCCVYQNIRCKSIKAKREAHQDPICLDGELTIIKTEDKEVEEAIKLLKEKGKLKDDKILVD